MTLGEKIALIRNEKKWTQEQLGKSIGVARYLIGKYETGVTQPPFEVVSKIAVVLNVSLDYLAGITERDPISKDSITRDLALLLTKIEKLSKQDRTLLETVTDALIAKGQLK
ncbi:helix-turn-helix domain-containing protein [Chitinophaga oryziterrae]|uniref:Helix-turn-helix domain-containing protein n=1 Tax=Chitinophaga oryziterrae TaxID=1031224 RepID=A0A6N8JH20_9BACT|nr:helix-turn-helix transcriptional regulator [Chitinophaga oryziterrae]MVT44595.1 helix-turn-helix domain-containing protein [Chitinophaga oryziterrae]